MSFIPTQTALEGFRLTRREPKALVAWALIYFVSIVISLVLSHRILAVLMQQITTLSSGTTMGEAQLMQLFPLYGQMMAINLPITLIATAVVHTAIIRAVIEPQQSQYGYLRLGSDELRMLGTKVLEVLIQGAAAFLGMGLVAMVAALGGMVHTALSVLSVLLLVPLVAGLVWLTLKLVLAAPATYVEKKIGIARSFQLTKGRLGPLLGTGLLALLLSLLVSFLASLVFTPLSLMTGGIENLLVATSGPVLAGLFVWCVVNAIVTSAQISIVYAPFASAYRDIVGR